jgi:hypothetical protein
VSGGGSWAGMAYGTTRVVVICDGSSQPGNPFAAGPSMGESFLCPRVRTGAGAPLGRLCSRIWDLHGRGGE